MMNKPRDPFADMPPEMREEVAGGRAFHSNQPRDASSSSHWLVGWDMARQNYMHELRMSTMAKSIAMHSTLDYKQACTLVRDALRDWDNLNATIPADRKSAA